MIVKSIDHLNSIAIDIGKKLITPSNILLFGEIGVGKTSFTRFLINFLQKKNKLKLTEVLSPTFNLLYEYEIKSYKAMHYDLYRLKSKEEIKQLGILNDNFESLKIIEWPELIKEDINDRLEIYFSYGKKENQRNLIFAGYGKFKNFKQNEI